MTKKYGKANQKSWKSILNTREQMTKTKDEEQEKIIDHSLKQEEPKVEEAEAKLEEMLPDNQEIPELTEIEAENNEYEKITIATQGLLSEAEPEEERKAAEGEDQKTIITADMKIIGDLEGCADLEFHGKITGNIITEGYVNMDGKIDGSIQALALRLNGGVVHGDILCEKTIEILPGSEVVGNLQAEIVTVNGHIRGDLYCGQMLTLLDHSVVEGNITTESISVYEGALVEGKLSMEKK
ncbi:bactofilin family protein [Holdemania massiliensis]|uniref:bactofilin family protein n=1 Tax=Holdemania massiliensis TaxID=1468449 RepID=UPI001F05DBD1|nr:polymer-forming cytoskeletal protein [Holdemania massiliensis]MCH1941923.1 polymer-forming cytoskeletal protein [Holdemania massiliensis]